MSEAIAEDLKKLSPEGELVASMIEGAWAVNDAWVSALEALAAAGDDKAERFSAIMGGMAATVMALGSIMAASSKARIAGIDNEIAAEKKRDGKSASSLAKIKVLEAKKEKAKKKAFEDNKKMQMANVIINTAAAIAEYLTNWPMMILAAALGAAQLAIIASTSYQGGAASVDAGAPAKIEVGKRTNKVDVSQQASAGELAYLRGERGIGTTATNFMPQGGAAGLRKGYAEGGEILVGERGPEQITPLSPMQVWPSDMGAKSQVNANFTIHAIDAAGVEEVLLQFCTLFQIIF